MLTEGLKVTHASNNSRTRGNPKPVILAMCRGLQVVNLPEKYKKYSLEILRWSL